MSENTLDEYAQVVPILDDKPENTERTREDEPFVLAQDYQMVADTPEEYAHVVPILDYKPGNTECSQDEPFTNPVPQRATEIISLVKFAPKSKLISYLDIYVDLPRSVQENVHRCDTISECREKSGSPKTDCDNASSCRSEQREDEKFPSLQSINLIQSTNKLSNGNGNDNSNGGPSNSNGNVSNYGTLLVRNLSHHTTTKDLQTAFGRFGHILDVYIPRDFHSHRLRGVAFIKYENSKNAEEAKTEMNQSYIKGRKLEVSFSQTKKKTPNEMRGRGSEDGDECERTRGNGKDGGGRGGDIGRGGGCGERDGGSGGGERDLNRNSSFERHKQRERKQGIQGGGNRRRSDGPPSESRHDEFRGPGSGNRSPQHHDRAGSQSPYENGLKMWIRGKRFLGRVSQVSRQFHTVGETKLMTDKRPSKRMLKEN